MLHRYRVCCKPTDGLLHEPALFGPDINWRTTPEDLGCERSMGGYLIPPVVHCRGKFVSSSQNMLRLFAGGKFGEGMLHQQVTIQDAAEVVDYFERIRALSLRTGLPVWPFRQVGIVTEDHLDS